MIKSEKVCDKCGATGAETVSAVGLFIDDQWQKHYIDLCHRHTRHMLQQIIAMSSMERNCGVATSIAVEKVFEAWGAK